MSTVLEMGLANAVVATLLGAGVLLFGRWLRRPALIHALWILVLVKLITPPIVSLPVASEWLSSPVGSDVAIDTGGLQALPAVTEAKGTAQPGDHGLTEADLQAWRSSAQATSGGPLPRDEDAAIASDVGEFAFHERVEVGSRPSTGRAAEHLAAPAAGPAAGRATTAAAAVVRWIPPLLATVWVLGIIAMALLTYVRAGRFQRLLWQSAREAPPDLQREMQELARLLGIRRVPRFVLVRAKVSPLVWALGSRPVIVFPQSLIAALDAAERRSLLLHELTHLRRR